MQPPSSNEARSRRAAEDTTMRRTLTMFAAVGMLAALMAPAALATTTREAFSCTTVLLVEQPGLQWWTGDTLHERGWQGIYTATGSPICAGTTTVVVDYQLDTATMSGEMTFRYDEQLASDDGGIMGLGVTKFDFVDVVWKGSTVGHGYGSLAGLQTRGSIAELFDGSVVETGIAFHPGE
jgi:hypothetical protein